MDPCPQCGAELDNPLGCGACNALLAADPEPSPYATFGLPVEYAVDPSALRKKLLRVSRLVHPDYFGSDPVQRALAERNTALLNSAYDILSDDYTRADWIVGHLGGPDEQAERQMPQEFLMEVLEWNETLEEAREAAPGSAERAALDGLRAELSTRRGGALQQLGESLATLPEAGAPQLADYRRQLNAIRYLDRTLRDLESLRLEQAAS